MAINIDDEYTAVHLQVPLRASLCSSNSAANLDLASVVSATCNANLPWMATPVYNHYCIYFLYECTVFCLFFLQFLSQFFLKSCQNFLCSCGLCVG